MLGISNFSVDSLIRKKEYSVFQKLDNKSISGVLPKVLTATLIVGILAMFLPWTQNIRSNGFVTTMNPFDRPQAIQSLIDGRITEWYVREGQTVAAGDTILVISESKEEYLDPQLLDRTKNQINAKKSSSQAYLDKANLLKNQYVATERNKSVKLEQNRIKITQVKLKIQTDSIDLEAAEIKKANGLNQLKRTEELYKKGIKSLTDFEQKTFSYRQAVAKVNEIENKIREGQNELDNLKNNADVIANDFDQKLAKIQSERMSALSQGYEADGEINKLESQFNKYEVRSNAYVITSPVSGIISETLKQGIGEYLKAGEDLLTIVPSEYQKAVEVFVEPRDMPLLEKGQRVRIQFDGWPAVVFSGWPNNSFGTFGGVIFAIDNDISPKYEGKYRILVAEDPDTEKWPEELRVGGGAIGLILLKEVTIFYEVWRQLNGFPPDYYKKESKEKLKTKAPIKKFK